MLSGDNGILQRATDAKTRTEKAQIIETVQTDILGQQTENKGANITKDQLTGILNKYFTPTDPTEIPDEISNTSDIPLTTIDEKYTINLSEIFKGKFSSENKKTAENLVVGEFVKYGNNISEGVYETNTAETGHTSVQRFVTNKNMLWKVLKVNNESIELIATQNILADDNTTGLYLSGRKGYTNAKKILKDLCESLYNSASITARSINANDINTLAGYVPTNANNSYDYQINENILLYDVLVAGTKQENWQDGKVNYTKWYWLSSTSERYLGPDYCLDVSVIENGELNFTELVHADPDEGYEDEQGFALGIRPVITINSSQIINKGMGTEQNPYEL